jgi:GNAT superfamily N-acetyltransferase
MNIQIARTDTEITACYPVMKELRPHLAEEAFLSRIRNLEKTGYRLAFAQQPEGIVAVAGFWLRENLAWDRFMYVDDLVTLSSHRSQGIGSRMLGWLREYAIKEGCRQLHLDSGTQRKDAHRFYEREGMTLFGYHFAKDVRQKNT